MTDSNIADLDPVIRNKAQDFLTQCNADPVFAAAGARVLIDQTYRNEVDQNADWQKGRDANGVIRDGKAVITMARYGQSPHNCTLPDGTPAARAFDFAIETEDGTLDWDAADLRWQRAIQIGEALGLVSGSTFSHLRDCPHMEMQNWKST